MFQDESRPSGGFILAETLALAGTAGDSVTAGGTFNQPVPDETPSGRISSSNIALKK